MTVIGDATSFWDLVERRVAESADRRFVFDDKGRSLTYGEFKDTVERVAAGLHAMGIGEGTPVSPSEHTAVPWPRPRGRTQRRQFAAAGKVGPSSSS